MLGPGPASARQRSDEVSLNSAVRCLPTPAMRIFLPLHNAVSFFNPEQASELDTTPFLFPLTFFFI